MLYTSGSPRSKEIEAYLRENISERNRHLLEQEKFAIVIGGDGFFFEMIKKLPDDTQFLPLNGGTLGYTLNDVDTLEEVLALIEARDWREYFFPKMKVIFKSPNREFELDEAANDVYIERSSGQTARLNFKVDDVQMLQEPVICDGMIVSTALGSTAYSLSAGGPIVHPALQTMGITFSNAHYPRIPPIMVPGGCNISITAEDQVKRPVRIVCDGREVNWQRKTGRLVMYELVLRYSASKSVSVFYFNGHCRTKQLARKIIRR